MRPQAAASAAQASKYLQGSELLAAAGFTNPSISAAIHAVIHAKDAICLEVLGQTRGSKHHLDAISELQSTGVVPKSHLDQFRSVISAKTEAEYGATEISSERFSRVWTQAHRFCSFVFKFLKFEQ